MDFHNRAEEGRILANESAAFLFFYHAHDGVFYYNIPNAGHGFAIVFIKWAPIHSVPCMQRLRDEESPLQVPFEVYAEHR